MVVTWDINSTMVVLFIYSPLNFRLSSGMVTMVATLVLPWVILFSFARMCTDRPIKKVVAIRRHFSGSKQ